MTYMLRRRESKPTPHRQQTPFRKTHTHINIHTLIGHKTEPSLLTCASPLADRTLSSKAAIGRACLFLFSASLAGACLDTTSTSLSTSSTTMHFTRGSTSSRTVGRDFRISLRFGGTRDEKTKGVYKRDGAMGSGATMRG